MEIPVAQLTYYHLAAVQALVVEEKNALDHRSVTPQNVQLSRILSLTCNALILSMLAFLSEPLEQSAVTESVAVDSPISQP